MQNLLILADSPDAFRELLRNILAELLPKTLEPVVQGDHETLLNGIDACREFGISKTTLSEWKKKGIVPFIRLGRRIYFERAAILAAGRSHQRYQHNPKRK